LLQFARFTAQAHNLARVAIPGLKLRSRSIRLAMFAQQSLYRLMHLVGLAHEVFALAALGFARIGRQLDPVDGNHLAPD
jgi:hypothetical protein